MMYTRGEYRDKTDAFGVLMRHSKHETEIVFILSGQVASAFMHNENGDFSFLNNKARNMYNIIKSGLAGCKAKNGQSLPFILGTSVCHDFTKTKSEYSMELFNGEIVRVNIDTVNDEHINMEYTETNSIPVGIPYIQLTVAKQAEDVENLEDDVIVRSVAEIALEKEDVTWLNNKKYYIVNDDEQAEQIFAYLDNYKGPISYDTETTGLKINCFGKINSDYKRQLEEYNSQHPDEQLRADRLVGIIFCVEDNISYYFPCFNRKFKNLYDSDTETRRKVINNIKSRYTIGEFATKQSDMADYIRNTPAEQWGCDVILMERVRDILEKGHIVAHNGAFEWKVDWQYEIDTNLKDDTMILHQIMYKFRSTTSNRGESSSLKYLAKVELGVDQWELGDFFPDFKEDNSGLVRANAKSRTKKKGNKIDFSYMTYEGTRIYAPTDGDVTLQLFKKYKTDMVKNHREQEYIYNVEVIVAMCIGYMEFYGHRIDEEKIYAVRDQTKAEIACIESEIRQEVGFALPNEIEAYNNLKVSMEKFIEADKSGDKGLREDANKNTLEATAELYKAIEEDKEHELNLASPAQVSELFYDVLGYPIQGDKKSVAKKQIKPLLKAKDDEGNLLYPVVKMYSDYKVKDTLMTKFFDNLTYYMYPGGLIFSSFGQISTATGRMSCSRPNAQQYPKAVTKIVVPRPGNIMMDADYSQIEYRVLTGLAGNDWLAELFADPDSDYHTLMASLMYDVPYASVTPKMRGDAKSFNFGIPYGMGFKSLAILLKGNSKPSSVEEAKEKYEAYFKNQPKTRKFFDQVKEMAQVNKFTKTFWSRYRYYSFTDADGNENNARKAAALRQAGNAIIQGCLAGDTLIQTKEYGIMKIEDITNKHLHVWDGEKWSNGDILYSGKKRKCVITFTNGQKFICSPIHKFLVKDKEGTEEFVECQNLQTSKNSTTPHNIVITKNYEPSDWRYPRGWEGKVYSTDFDTTNQIHPKVFQDTELLRERLGIIFNKMGEIEGQRVTLAFENIGNVDNKEAVDGIENKDSYEFVCRQIQKSLLFFGIRSTYSEDNNRSIVTIEENDTQKFIDTIGFKGDGTWETGKLPEYGEAKHQNHTQSIQTLIPQSVEITDEYIDMYDVCNTDGGYYVADGIITHNTAADIFKISVARNFMYIRENGLLGVLLIINMIHDEQLFEVDISKVNMQRILADVGRNMQFKVEGFPPLYIGAGIGPAWGKAKGKMAEIHPLLLDRFTEEAVNIPLWRTDTSEVSEEDIYKYFDARILDFRTEKVRNYLLDPKNYGKDLNPAIGNLLNLQFTYGHDKDKEGLADDEFTKLCLSEFIKANHLEGITPDYFIAKKESMEDVEEDKEYEDEDDFDEDETEIYDGTFSIIDESNVMYGASLQDLIAQFHFFVSPDMGVCCIDSLNMNYNKKDELVEYLYNHLCDQEDDGAMEIIFLQDGNTLNRTGLFVNNIRGSEVETRLHSN